jgi:hypothetical protein
VVDIAGGLDTEGQAMIEAIAVIAVLFLLRRRRRAPPIVVHVHQYFQLSPPGPGERRPTAHPEGTSNVVPLRRREKIVTRERVTL